MRVWHCGTATATIAPPLAEADEDPTPTGIAPTSGSRTDELSEESASYDSVAASGQLDVLISGRREQRIHARDDPVVELTRPELRNDIRVENRADAAVGQHALETIADLDPHRAIACRPEEQQSVVAVFLPMPHISNSLAAASSTEMPSRERMHDNRHLDTGAALERADRVVETRDGVGAQGAGHVGDPRAVCTRGFGMLLSGSAPATSSTGIATTARTLPLCKAE